MWIVAKSVRAHESLISKWLGCGLWMVIVHMKGAITGQSVCYLQELATGQAVHPGLMQMSIQWNKKICLIHGPQEHLNTFKILK